MLGRMGIAAATVLLAGCAEVSSGLMAASSLSRLWFDWPPEAAVAEAAPLPPEAPLYCYRTLADTECHAEPLEAAEETRRVGHAKP
jgi:hypothetical protein